MISSTTILVARQYSKHATNQLTRSSRRAVATKVAAAAHGSSTSSNSNNAAKLAAAAGSALVLGAAATASTTVNNTSCDAPKKDLTYTVTRGRVPLGEGIISNGPIVKEKATGISFPNMCGGMKLVGTGVRIKFVFVKVYAVGTYMDPVAMAAVKSRPEEEIEQALLDPTYPRVIRIELAREITSKQFVDAVCEALEPRMHGQDLWALEEFKSFNPDGLLMKGAQTYMTIRGDTLLYESPGGVFGQIKSKTFCKAMCDVYYGKDPVSPTHKQSVMDGVPKNM